MHFYSWMEANSAFKWILFSVEPLSPKDLVGLVAWDIGIRTDKLDISHIFDAYQSSHCANFHICPS